MMPAKDYPFSDVYGNTENESRIPSSGGLIDGIINALALEALAILAVVVVYELWVVVKRWL